MESNFDSVFTPTLPTGDNVRMEVLSCHSKRYLLIRCVVILAVLSWLIALNPANEAAYLFPKRGILKPQDRYAMRRTTNYLFFAIQERTIEVTIRVADQRWNCPYDAPVYGEVVCQHFLKDYLAHEQPLLYYSSGHHRVYTTHRFLAWTIVAATIYSVCSLSRPILYPSRNILRNAFLSLWIVNDERIPFLQVLIERLVEQNLFVYPGLRAMHVTVDDEAWIQYLALWFGMLVVCNAATIRHGTPLLGWRTLSAAATGYHMSIRRQLRLEDEPWYTVAGIEVKWQHLTWMAVSYTMFYRGGLRAALAWAIVYFVAGQIFAEWQYRNG